MSQVSDNEFETNGNDSEEIENENEQRLNEIIVEKKSLEQSLEENLTQRKILLEYHRKIAIENHMGRL